MDEVGGGAVAEVAEVASSVQRQKTRKEHSLMTSQTCRVLLGIVARAKGLQLTTVTGRWVSEIRNTCVTHIQMPPLTVVNIYTKSFCIML